VQVSTGGVYDSGYHAVWCSKYRRPVLVGRAGGHCEEPVRAEASGHGRRIATREIVSDQVRLFVKAHPSDSPSPDRQPVQRLDLAAAVASFPHLRSRLPASWSRSYSAATADAVPEQTVCRSTSVQHRRPWRKERVR
jgi:putative transposase